MSPLVDMGLCVSWRRWLLTDEVIVLWPRHQFGAGEEDAADGGRSEMITGLIAVFWSCLSACWVS